MQLTRHVLTEKSPLFSRYANPKDVPDEFWQIAFNEIGNIRNNNSSEFIKYIADKILSPLLNKLEYHISGTVIYDPNTFTPFKFIVFDSKWTFRVSAEMLQDLTGFYVRWDSLKEMVCIMWDNNVRINQNLDENILI